MTLKSTPLSRFLGPIALIMREGESGGTPTVADLVAGATPTAEPAVADAAEVAAVDPNAAPTDAVAGATPAVATAVAADPNAVPSSGGKDAAARIRELTADKWQATRAREAADAENALLRQQNESFMAAARAAGVQVPGMPQNPSAGLPGQTTPGAAPTFTAADLRAEVAAQAAELRYKEQCDQLVEAGRKGHGAAFDAAIGQLNKYGPVPRHVVEAALETGLGPDVLLALGNDPMEADRILSLQPQRVGVALERIAAGVRAAVPAGGGLSISRAPAPIKAAAGAQGATKAFDPNDPDASIDEWMKWRNKTLKKTA